MNMQMHLNDLLWRYGWLKNPATWLTENFFAQIFETEIFPSMGFVQEHNKYKFSF